MDAIAHPLTSSLQPTVNRRAELARIARLATELDDDNLVELREVIAFFLQCQELDRRAGQRSGLRLSQGMSGRLS